MYVLFHLFTPPIPKHNTQKQKAEANYSTQTSKPQVTERVILRNREKIVRQGKRIKM